MESKKDFQEILDGEKQSTGRRVTHDTVHTKEDRFRERA